MNSHKFQVVEQKIGSYQGVFMEGVENMNFFEIVLTLAISFGGQ